MKSDTSHYQLSPSISIPNSHSRISLKPSRVRTCHKPGPLAPNYINPRFSLPLPGASLIASPHGLACHNHIGHALARRLHEDSAAYMDTCNYEASSGPHQVPACCAFSHAAFGVYWFVCGFVELEVFDDGSVPEYDHL